jgi:hypothetical protein
MARKGWTQLSAGYRARLEKAGISQTDYERGESIRAARGHATTPERPTQSQNFPMYKAQRTQLTYALLRKKKEFFSGSGKWNPIAAARKYKSAPPPMALMKQWLKMSKEEWLNAIRADTESIAYLGYH